MGFYSKINKNINIIKIISLLSKCAVLPISKLPV